MKAMSWLATGVALSCFLVNIAHSAPPAAQARWTIMVYMSGDNNLEDYIVKDLEQELGLAGSDANVKVVALADRGPKYDTSRGDWQTTKLFFVTQGQIADAAHAAADWGERDFGDPQTLIDFVTWTKANHPADHYALYFWGHGWNWHPGFVMEDDTNNGDTLDYDEMKAAIPQLGFIDVVGYDGCNMASIEIYKLWQNKATTVSASEEYVGWNGIEYDSVIAQLKANPFMTADQVGIATAQSAINLGGERTWSAVAVDGRLGTLLTATDQFAVALTNGLAANRKKYDHAFGATRSMWQAPMDKDLYDMASEIAAAVSDAGIKAKAKAVMDAFSTTMLWEGHTNAYAQVHGMTIYHIGKASEKDSDYAYYRSTLDFALSTNWDEFLNAYAQ